MPELPSWTERKPELQTLARVIDPSVTLTTKDSWFWALLAWLRLLIGFGSASRADFLTRFATTLGPVQAYPKEWDYEKVRQTLIHESRHTRQSRVFGWFVPVLGWIPPLAPWVGLLLMAPVYGLLPVPVLGAWCRYRLELDAERFRWRWYLKATPPWPAEYVRLRAVSFADTISSGQYLWTVPRCWARWGFRRCAERDIAAAA